MSGPGRIQASLARAAPRPAISMVRVARMCDSCRGDEDAKLQRAVDPAASAADHHFAQVAVAPPAASGETVEVSDPGDASERDADRMAAQALSGAAGVPAASLAGGRLQLARAMDEAAAPGSPAVGSFLVDDDAATLLPGQMRKGAFLAALREEACAAANRELARAGRSTEGCPYLARWFDYYEQRDARHVERALRKYAPDAAQATSAAGYIPIVSARAAQAARRWAETGALPEMPEGMGAEMMGGGLLGAIGGAIGGALSAIGGLLFKAESGGARGGVDRGALESRLGPGQPLDGGAQARMGAAFGHDFSRVRVHADRSASEAASALNARAFTLGEHVAFAAGQYRPGSLAGDALLAHELAHVVQQGGAAHAADGNATPAVEEDADAATAGVLGSLYDGERPTRPHRPRLRSGLRLSRCSDDDKYKLAQTPRKREPLPPWNNRESMRPVLYDPPAPGKPSAIQHLWDSPYDVDHNTAQNLTAGLPPIYRARELESDTTLTGAKSTSFLLPVEPAPRVSYRSVPPPPPDGGITARSPGTDDEPVIILGEDLLVPPIFSPELEALGMKSKTAEEKQSDVETVLVHEMAHAVNKSPRAIKPEERLDPDSAFGHYMTEFGARWVEPRFRKYQDLDRRAREIRDAIISSGNQGYDDIISRYRSDSAFKSRVDDYDRPKGFELSNTWPGPPRPAGK